MSNSKSIYTIVSTRPELIRLSRIIAKLDNMCQHTLIYTGQNFDPKLSTIFFEDLNIRPPNVSFKNISSDFGAQIGLMFTELEKHFERNRPDKVLILGDTNGCLCAIICKRLGIPIVHMEAGNRCGEWINEEVNRHIIDCIADVHLPYTTLSKQNLLAEGIPNQSIFVTGNPIAEVLDYYSLQIEGSQSLLNLKLRPKEYFLATFHRNENVTDVAVLKHIIHGLTSVSDTFKLPVVCAIHPKTKTNLEKFEIRVDLEKLIFIEPTNLSDFVKLEKNAVCIITDSGTCPEEGTILRVPSVIIRKTTERPELIQCGSTILSGTRSCDILDAVETILKCDNNWKVPEEYTYLDVSDRVVKILLGNLK